MTSPLVIAFETAIAGGEITARFTPSADVAAPIWCFSLLAPGRVISGGHWVTGTGGYCEIALPDLVAGQTHQVQIAYDGDFIPKNRAWLPLGSYFRLTGGACFALPPMPQGTLVADGPTERERAPSAFAVIPRPQNTMWLDEEPPVPVRQILPHGDFPDGIQIVLEACALSQRCGFGPLTDTDGVDASLTYDPDIPAEGYKLSIMSDGIAIRASDSAGLFYGAVTLITLIQTHNGLLNIGTLEDAPRFGWRGQHLDCARHFFQVETIERLFDLMALLKLNRFHWHFADDEAFRLEVDCAPDLWRKTAFRGEGELVPATFGAGIRSGGSYSKTDVVRLRARAKALHIDIMPEIELPAHALALTRAIPGLRDPDDNGQEISIQGYRQNAVNPARPEVLAFLDPLIAELATLFPDSILHLGCDELAPDTWAGSPQAQALCAREGLAGRDDLQGWFMEQVGALTRRHGLRPAAWEEAAKGANGGIGHDALLFSWTGQGPGIAAARAGYDVIMCPAQHCYLDMAHTADPADWGATWAATIALEDTVDWQVVPVGAEDITPRIQGIQGAYWGEFTTDDRQMEAMLAPRLLGIAQKGWARENSLDPAELSGFAAAYAPLFDLMGWQRHPSAQKAGGETAP